MATLAATPAFVSEGATIQPLLEINFRQPSDVLLRIPACCCRFWLFSDKIR
ncbi:hypothetical protein RHMOL_Rhmol06G0191000 [Rhododendron molle]|uniref:Uncharacterized protein n=1 Tax=Rhododendron molle TaxID=49168 RepID=A0ACC0NE32_RHOML|nr:hypothetical protein RHMOL_Rhmol06G0191000 [Rhododendron molle]